MKTLMRKMKGYRTLIVGWIAGIGGTVLVIEEALLYSGLVESGYLEQLIGEEAVKVMLAIVGGSMIVLRYFTTTAVGKKE